MGYGKVSQRAAGFTLKGWQCKVENGDGAIKDATLEALGSWLAVADFQSISGGVS